jgi:hypothetical protein
MLPGWQSLHAQLTHDPVQARAEQQLRLKRSGYGTAGSMPEPDDSGLRSR